MATNLAVVLAIAQSLVLVWLAGRWALRKIRSATLARDKKLCELLGRIEALESDYKKLQEQMAALTKEVAETSGRVEEFIRKMAQPAEADPAQFLLDLAKRSSFQQSTEEDSLNEEEVRGMMALGLPRHSAEGLLQSRLAVESGL